MFLNCNGQQDKLCGTLHPRAEVFEAYISSGQMIQRLQFVVSDLCRSEERGFASCASPVDNRAGKK
jgi:hypothetical protein